VVSCGGSVTTPTTQPAPVPTDDPEPVTTQTMLAGTALGGTLPYGSRVTVKAGVTTADSGQALVNVPVSVCLRAAPATTDRCSTLTTDAGGSVGYTLTLQGRTSVYVRYAGSTTTAASKSATATYRVMPKVTPHGGRRQVTAAVAPGTALLTLDRWTGHAWKTVRTIRAAAGRATFARLPAGQYRVRTAATATLLATVSPTVRAT
jgi:hypothetical protein